MGEGVALDGGELGFRPAPTAASASTRCCLCSPGRGLAGEGFHFGRSAGGAPLGWIAPASAADPRSRSHGRWRQRRRLRPAVVTRETVVPVTMLLARSWREAVGRGHARKVNISQCRAQRVLRLAVLLAAARAASRPPRCRGVQSCALARSARSCPPAAGTLARPAAALAHVDRPPLPATLSRRPASCPSGGRPLPACGTMIACPRAGHHGGMTAQTPSHSLGRAAATISTRPGTPPATTARRSSRLVRVDEQIGRVGGKRAGTYGRPRSSCWATTV